MGKDKRLENSKFSRRSSISCPHRVALSNADLRPRRARPLVDDARKERSARATCCIKARIRASVLSCLGAAGALRLGGAERDAVPSETCSALEFLIGGIALGSRWALDGTAQMAAGYHLSEKSPHRWILCVKRLFSSLWARFKEAFPRCTRVEAIEL